MALDFTHRLRKKTSRRVTPDFRNDEQTLIKRARSGDSKAFERLVSLKREKAVRVALNIVGNLDDARDVAQLAFIKLWSAFGDYDEESPFDPWFFRIVVNLAIDFYRKERSGIPLSAQPVEEAAGAVSWMPRPGADERVIRREVRRIFGELAGRLTPQQRAAFTLKEIEGASTEEIAKIMGVSHSTVRNHLLSARRVLQEGLRRRYPEYFKDRGR